MKPGLAMKRSTLQLCLILAWLPAVAVAVAGYLAVVAPLTEKALLAEAYGTARRLDESLMVRSVVLDMATGELHMAKLQEPAVLDELLRSIRSQFPDFISLEVIDEKGSIVSMVGELSLSEQGLPLHANTTDLPHSRSNGYRYAWAFRDDPGSDSYYLTRERTEPDGKRWFSRARFARGPIQAAMDSPLGNHSLRVGLVPVQTSGSHRPEDSAARGTVRSFHAKRDGMTSPQITEYQWAVAARAAARLESPGWQVTVESGSQGTMIWYGILLLAGLSLIHVLFAIRVVRNSRHAVRHESFPRGPGTPPMLNRLVLHHDFRAPVSELQPPSEPCQEDLSTSQPLTSGFDPIWPEPLPGEHETAAPRDELPENEPPVGDSDRGAVDLPEFLEVEWAESPYEDASQNRNTGEDEHRFPEASSFHTG